jgi:peptidyl-prolyl cis-trans isomerase B (cyclophilin B)
MRQLVITIVAAGLLAIWALSGCGDDEEQAPTTTAEGEVRQAPECEPKKGARPKGETATVETSEGSFEIALATRESPLTVSSFTCLAESGFYDGLTFNRVAPGFLIQGGDPKGDRTGGPGYTVVEPPPEDTAYTRGVVAMAKSPVEPHGSAGSQFFVVTGADAGLPPDYALLGEVTTGFDTVEAIEGLADSPDGPPSEEVTIDGVAIEG